MVQLAAMCSSLTGRYLVLPPRHLRLLVACGATAGITAAYNAPIAGAIFISEIVYGVIPQALPLVASYSLLLFETNVRQATMLGIVGAGGVGFVLSKYMALFQYQHLMGALILIVVMVTGIDRVSDAIRRRLT